MANEEPFPKITKPCFSASSNSGVSRPQPFQLVQQPRFDPLLPGDIDGDAKCPNHAPLRIAQGHFSRGNPSRPPIATGFFFLFVNHAEPSRVDHRVLVLERLARVLLAKKAKIRFSKDGLVLFLSRTNPASPY